MSITVLVRLAVLLFGLRAIQLISFSFSFSFSPHLWLFNAEESVKDGIRVWSACSGICAEIVTLCQLGVKIREHLMLERDRVRWLSVCLSVWLFLFSFVLVSGVESCYVHAAPFRELFAFSPTPSSLASSNLVSFFLSQSILYYYIYQSARKMAKNFIGDIREIVGATFGNEAGNDEREVRENTFCHHFVSLSLSLSLSLFLSLSLSLSLFSSHTTFVTRIAHFIVTARAGACLRRSLQQARIPLERYP